MPVTSTDDRQVRRKHPTAVVSAAAVERVANRTIQVSSFVVLAGSFIGTIMAINGRWPDQWDFWKDVSPIAVIAGIAIQSFCTLMEWGSRRKRFSLRYGFPFLIDVVGTYIGYAALFVPMLVAGFLTARMAPTLALVVSHIIVLVGSVFVAYWPEMNLVED